MQYTKSIVCLYEILRLIKPTLNLKTFCMKLKTFNSAHLILAGSAVALTFVLVSWNPQKPSWYFKQNRQVTDTVPIEKNNSQDKKVTDVNKALKDLDQAEMNVNMEKVQKEISEAMKKIDKIDMEKIKTEIDKAMKDVDINKIQKEVQESVAKIDWQQIKSEMEKVKNINMDKLQDEMKEVQKQMEKMKPEIQKEMEKAKEQIEKAKENMTGYKELVDGLEKDGVINKKEEYSIKHKNGELIVNGKKVSDEEYNKYRSFLENHKTFTIEKNDADFNIHTGKDKD